VFICVYARASVCMRAHLHAHARARVWWGAGRMGVDNCAVLAKHGGGSFCKSVPSATSSTRPPPPHRQSAHSGAAAPAPGSRSAQGSLRATPSRPPAPPRWPPARAPAQPCCAAAPAPLRRLQWPRRGRGAGGGGALKEARRLPLRLPLPDPTRPPAGAWAPGGLRVKGAASGMCAGPTANLVRLARLHCNIWRGQIRPNPP
jgi:hypothetical protein